MKKIILSAVFVFVALGVNAKQNDNQYCFNLAINAIEAFESMGQTYTDEEYVGNLNDFYAGCMVGLGHRY